MKHIVGIQLQNMLAEVEKSRGIKLIFSKSAKDALVQEGYDPAFGARPLKRVIQKRILDKLAKSIIEGQVKDGQTVQVDFDGSNFIFK
jgi:ATP-dependent Clp protease ATP-binding subunit ClpA